MHPFREPTFPKTEMKRDSVWVVVAVAGVVAVISASIPLGLEYYESHALALPTPKAPPTPEVAHHVALPKKMLEASSSNATLVGGYAPPVFALPDRDRFMMLRANSCIASALDHDPRGKPGIRCSKDGPRSYICWDEHAPGGLRMAPTL